MRMHRNYQIPQRTRTHHDLDIRAIERGTQKLQEEVSRQGRHRTYSQNLPPLDGLVLEHVQHFRSSPMNGLGVLEHESPRLRE